jgi:3-keto-5-aminohexanoate cleavage enzyme
VIELVRAPDAAVSAARVLDAPLLVCRASGTCVVPLELQRDPKR